MEMPGFGSGCVDDLESLLCNALRTSGFNVLPNRVSHAPEIKVTVRVRAHLGGAIAGNVDATYKTYSIEAPETIMDQLGPNIYFRVCDSVTCVGNDWLKTPNEWLFEGVILARGYTSVSEMQTVYLAMQGVYEGLPPFNSLSSKQRDMVKNHIDMLAEYLRK